MTLTYLLGNNIGTCAYGSNAIQKGGIGVLQDFGCAGRALRDLKLGSRTVRISRFKIHQALVMAYNYGLLLPMLSI